MEIDCSSTHQSRSLLQEQKLVMYWSCSGTISRKATGIRPFPATHLQQKWVERCHQTTSDLFAARYSSRVLVILWPVCGGV